MLMISGLYLGYVVPLEAPCDFGCCCLDGRGALQSPNCWRSFRVRAKTGKDEMDVLV